MLALQDMRISGVGSPPGVIAVDWKIAVVCGFAGLAIVVAVVRLIVRSTLSLRFPHRLEDLHHTHRTPIPRFGGLALVLAFVGVEILVETISPDPEWLGDKTVVVLSSLAIFGLGFWDDLKPLGAKWKLGGQVAVAVLVYGCGLGIQHFELPFIQQDIEMRSVGLLLTVFWLVGMTNLVNLIDGVDGLAGGICLVLMVLMGYMLQGAAGFSYLMWGMVGALLGFLWFNFPPARIYLGDGGAYFLGFHIGLVSLLNYQKSTIVAALVAPLLVLALPIVDTLIAITRRGLRGLPIFRADQRHIHHYLIRMGMSRRRVVLCFYGVTLFFLVLAFAVLVSRGHLIPLSLGVGVLVLLLFAGKLEFSREWFAVGRVVGNSLAMRRQIQYALALTRWLVLEGGRARSLDDLWQDLVFIGRKLGFSYIKLTLADGQREWAEVPLNRRHPEQSKVLEAGNCGMLELRCKACGRRTRTVRRNCLRGMNCPCLSDDRLFAILCELLVEGWMAAARKHARRQGGALTLQPTGLTAAAASNV